VILSNRYNFTKYINNVAVLYAFIIPISRAGIVFFTALMILLWVLEGDFKNKFINMKNNNLIVLIIALMALYFISLSWSDTFINGFKYSIKFWYFIPIFVIFTSVKKEYIKYMISAFLISMLISEIISYGIFFEWWNFKNRPPNDPTPFMNHLQYSMFLAFTALLLLNKAFIEKNIITKMGYILFFITVSINLFINGGRTGQVAFIVSLFVVGFLNIKKKFKAVLYMLVLATSILYTGYNLSPNFKHRVDYAIKDMSEIIHKQNYCHSFGMRVGMWIVAIDIIKDNPIVGVGVSDAMTTMRSYINEFHSDKKCAKPLPNFHNDFVQLLVQLGFIGGILYLLIFYNIFRIKIKDNEYKNLPIIFGSVYFISSMFENMIHQQFSMLLFALFVGIFVAQKRIEEEERKSLIG